MKLCNIYQMNHSDKQVQEKVKSRIRLQIDHLYTLTKMGRLLFMEQIKNHHTYKN